MVRGGNWRMVYPVNVGEDITCNCPANRFDPLLKHYFHHYAHHHNNDIMYRYSPPLPPPPLQR